MSTNPKRLGKYELQERLGQGGMAEVWKAFDPQLKRYVAIKFLHTNLRSDADFIARFEREGQAIASLRHPNIVQVYDFQAAPPEDDSPSAYMIMDYIEGETLASYVRRTSYAQKFPSPSELVSLFTPLCLAVDYAHQHHMIHRDIKPANILLDTRNTMHNTMGEPILTDFGIVKMLGAATTLTATGASMGTPLYISPEQIKGQQGNERSDIYSLGVMLYEICAGKPPFRGDTPYAIMAQHMNNTPPPPSQYNPDITPAVDAVILRCLAKNPNERYPSASAIVADLAGALNVPVPEQIKRVVASSDPAEQPTYYEPLNPGLALKDTPAPDSSLDAMETQLDADITPIAKPAATASEQRQPVAVAENRPVATAAKPATPPPASTPVIERSSPETPTELLFSHAPTPPPTPPGRRKGLLTIIIAAALFVLIGSSAGTFFLISRHNSISSTSSSAANTNVVGVASFFSSGELNNQGVPSINDGMEIHLQNIPAPAAGNRYYAWLQDNQTETVSIALGALTVNQGIISLTYMDNQHRDLLATMTNFLITEESANVIPNNPSLDKGQWRYNASLPQLRSPKDNFSYLDHIRHLLSIEPDLDRLQLRGGIDFWFLNNLEEMHKETMEVKDHGNIQEVRQLVANILYYLDGKCALQDLNNALGSKLPENPAIAHDTSVGLLDCAQTPVPPGHLTHIALHLNGIAQAPGASPNQIKLAIEINKDLNNVKAWLVQLRTDAMQLATMDDTQLGQAQALRNDMVVQANYVLGGRVDPATQALEPSAVQISNDIEFLASFDVMPFKSH